MCNDKINLLDAHVLGVGVALMYACVKSGCGYLLDEILGKNENMSQDFLNGILDAHVLGRSAHVCMGGRRLYWSVQV